MYVSKSCMLKAPARAARSGLGDAGPKVTRLPAALLSSLHNASLLLPFRRRSEVIAISGEVEEAAYQEMASGYVMCDML